ncbi:serine/threonine-protein kinase [Cellulomonas sp.]|uniref:serine/threonine-protein kinase n=1 Tax=Cellulomonas sp. TaxID=40001 RepID=UPI001B09AC5E|nr:serine/threonine-protein kinase [Cellulomonas sp.]MBO9555222.1 serine/threonine protein kinase [Cellulomonas sp.]
MTARREASTPPRLPGYEYVRVLGLGGFADVFLYEQELPRREVAVKVLLAGSLDDDVRSRFQTEANLMARLSHHPSIVTIHQADIAADGRPYLVMEYCSRPGLAERYRQERISVAESLRIGIRLSAAIETAHRAGILHRDIKPANVLTTDFGWPALTDFGIAATTGGVGATVGMSIPWSPPELLGEHPTGDERSDVYSLAATIYSLLAGRTPFEIPGGQNGAQQLVARIERSPLPPTGRDDVPYDLQALLERAMSKHPARRHPSAAAVGRALQQIEADLRLPVTPLDLLDDLDETAPPATITAPDAPERDDATRLRSIVTVQPTVPTPPPPAPVVRVAPPVVATTPGDDDATRLRPVVTVAPVTDTRTANPSPEAVPLVVDPGDPRRARGARRTRLVVGSVSALVVAGAAVAIALNASDDDPGTSTPPGATQDFTDGTQDDDGADAPVPSPHSLAGTRQADGSVVFTWENPAPQDGDRYLWGVLSATGEPTLEIVDVPTVTVPAASGEVCIEVSIVRANRQASATPAQGCAP